MIKKVTMDDGKVRWRTEFQIGEVGFYETRKQARKALAEWKAAAEWMRQQAEATKLTPGTP